MSKKNKGQKRFRVAISGPTIDGRNIPANHIEEMAANYDPKHYQARIWLEHLKSIWPDSDFKAYGDVLGLEARKEEIGGETVTALYAYLSVSDELKMLNQKGQKIFSSIEYHPNFRDKGYAYLTGLAATDTPASAGTEPLVFSINQTDANATYSGTVEMSALDNADTADIEPDVKEESKLVSAFAQFTDSLKSLFSKKENDETEAITQNLSQISELLQNEATARNNFEEKFAEQASEISSLKTELSELKEQLAKEPKSHTFTPNVHLSNPEGDEIIKTDY